VTTLPDIMRASSWTLGAPGESATTEEVMRPLVDVFWTQRCASAWAATCGRCVTHRTCRPAATERIIRPADTGVGLVEDHGGGLFRASAAEQGPLQGQPEPGGLASRGHLGQRSHRLSGVGGEEELHLVGPVGAEHVPRRELHLEAGAGEGQLVQLDGDAALELSRRPLALAAQRTGGLPGTSLGRSTVGLQGLQALLPAGELCRLAAEGLEAGR